MYTLGGFETKLIAEEIGENFNWDVVSMPKVPDGGKTIFYTQQDMPC